MAFENPTDPSAADLPDVLDVPVLAIRNTVIFPVLAFHLLKPVGESGSNTALLSRNCWMMDAVFGV